MSVFLKNRRHLFRGLIAFAAILLIGGLMFAISSLLKHKEAPDEAMQAALEPVFKQEEIRAPFTALAQKSLFSEKLIIQFSPNEAQKANHGRKDVLLLPLVVTGHHAPRIKPGLDEIEIRSINADENAVRLGSAIPAIRKFVAQEMDLAAFQDQAVFEVTEWQPRGRTKEEKAREFLERGRVFANRKGDPKRALLWFQQASDLVRDDFDILFALGVTHHALGDLPNAIRCLEGARDLKPGEYRIHPALARCYLAEKQNGSAVNALKEFAELRRNADRADPFLIPAVYQAAAACFDLGYYKDADVLVRELLELAPDHAHGWALLGQTQYNLKLKKDALASFQKAAALGPRDPYLLQQLGWYFCELKDFPQAVAAYRRSYTYGNRDTALFMGLSHAYHRTGNYFDAKHVLVEGFRHHLNDPDLERNFRAIHWTIVKRRLRPKGPPTPIALSEG